MNKIWSIADIKAVLKETGNKMGMSCDHVPVKISSRMTRCKGQYTCTTKDLTPVKFTFAAHLLNGQYNYKTVKQVIIHEYCHFYANTYYKASCNHDYRFKAICREAGISDNTYFEKVSGMETEEPKEVITTIQKPVEVVEPKEEITPEMIQQTAQLELLNLQGKNNKQIIELALLANVINFEYDGDNLKTYAQWKNAGYQVQRGEKALIQIELWTPCKYQVAAMTEGKEGQEEKKEYTKMYLKKSSLFSMEQVKKIGE